jgi:hypothetical protein
MADEEIQKKPALRDARLEPLPQQHDDNRFRQPDPVLNRMALLSFRLGAFAVILGLTDRYHGGGVWMFEPVLSPAALIFGILGIRYRNRHPTAGGLADAISGIVLGLLPVGAFFSAMTYYFNMGR